MEYWRIFVVFSALASVLLGPRKRNNARWLFALRSFNEEGRGCRILIVGLPRKRNISFMIV